MEIRPIRTDKDDKAALAEIEVYWVHLRVPKKAIGFDRVLPYTTHPRNICSNASAE
jgi:hypothetical protein